MATSSRAVAAPPPAAVTAFNAYITTVESRLAQQHQSQDAFLAPTGSDPQTDARLRRGELIIERIKPSAATSGAMLHHWRGTAFVPGTHAADFERLMRDFDAYPRIFSPQVVRAKILAELGNHLQVMMRVRQRHVITVVLDTTYDVTFTQLDPKRGFSISRSTQISEIASPGTATEHALDSSHDHGFMWRLNSYWTYQERDGGLYMQIESVSLTRSIPFGLAWVVGPFVESVPRESLEFTLSHVCTALRDEERTSQ
jgi:hypothetical protein